MICRDLSVAAHFLDNDPRFFRKAVIGTRNFTRATVAGFAAKPRCRGLDHSGHPENPLPAASGSERPSGHADGECDLHSSGHSRAERHPGSPPRTRPATGLEADGPETARAGRNGGRPHENRFPEHDANFRASNKTDITKENEMPESKSLPITLRGGRMAKTARGIISFAPMMAGAAILLGGISGAQALTIPCADLIPNEMCDPGVPGSGVPSDTIASQTAFFGISGDGTVAVGWSSYSAPSNSTTRAYRWTAAGGWEDLGTLRADNGGIAQATAVSADGRVIVGGASNDTVIGYYNSSTAFRWEDGVMTDLGTLQDDNGGWSAAYGVSADGLVVVGAATGKTPDGNDRIRAFRWEAGTMSDLGSLEPGEQGNSQAYGASGDGAIVVGYSYGDSIGVRAFRWEDGVMTDIGTLRPDNQGQARAYGVSADGRIIVGQAESEVALNAFRWTDGTMEALATLRTSLGTQSFAAAVSADGNVIVGYDTNDNDEVRAVRWTGLDSIEDLGTLRSDNQGYSMALDVSDDGKTIVGASHYDGGSDNPSDMHAFIYRTAMQDLTNVVDSVDTLADDTAVAIAAQQDALGFLAEEGFLARKDHGAYRISGNLLSTGADHGAGIGSATTRGGFLSYGYGVSDQLTLGASIGIFHTNSGTGAFDSGSGHGFSLWAEASEGGLERTGWQGSAVLAWGKQDVTITRGLGFDNVMLASGHADLDTRMAHASIGYGIRSADWLLTPSVGLTHFRSTRSGYAESGSDTLATYDELAADRTTLTLALEGETLVSAAGHLSLGLGVEHDLNADGVRLSGTSDIPGLAAFQFESGLERNDTRGFVSVGYRHDLDENSLVSFDLNVGQAQLGNGVQTGLRIGYLKRF